MKSAGPAGPHLPEEPEHGGRGWGKGSPPGEETLDARNLVDVRLEKRVPLGEVGFLGLILDVRNIFNDSSIVFMDDVRLGSSDYLVPGSLVLPRTLRLAVRFVF